MIFSLNDSINIQYISINCGLYVIILMPTNMEEISIGEDCQLSLTQAGLKINATQEHEHHTRLALIYTGP